MRIGLQLLLAAALSFPLTQQSARADDQPAFKDDREKASYAIGMYFGTQLKGADLNLDMDVVINTMKEMLAGHEMKLNQQDAQAAIRTYQQQHVREATEKNTKEGEAFLAANKNKEGVKTREVKLPDGSTAEFQYKVLKQGEGQTPASSDIVKVNYRGTLINGTEFDNSAKHGSQPVSFPVKGVIPGWSEALQLMPVGSKWELYIPASLAYRDQGRPNIPPGSTLLFEVELVSAEPPPQPQPQPQSTQQPLTSDIIKVPSAEDMKRGSNIQVLKPEDIERAAAEARKQGRTNGH